MRIATILSAALLLLLPLSDSLASGCRSRPSITEGVQNSRIVFAGKVVARLKYGVRFRVETSWKGAPKRSIYIFTGNLRNDVDPWFEKGQRWLVYASYERLYNNANGTGGYKIKLISPTCNRTVLLADAAEDLRALGSGTRVK